MRESDRIARRLRVRDLQMVEIIAAQGSMARAAEALGLSQPAVSKAIADLEHTLRVALFERSSRGVALTDGGLVLLRRGRAIMDELRHGIEEIENIADPTTGHVRVGVSLAQSLFISAVIAQVSRRYPKITFNVEMADPLRLLRALRDRELDLAICRGQMAEWESDLQADDLFRDRIEVVSSPNHPLARRRKLRLSDLMQEPWALPPVDTYLGDLVRKAFHAQSLPAPTAVVTTSSLQLRLELMETGGFLTLASRSMVTHPSRRGRLKALPVAFDDDAGPMAAITLKGRQLTNVSRLVLQETRLLARSVAVME
jgi:DNA-binding transcriptional LysR family regulator